MSYSRRSILKAGVTAGVTAFAAPWERLAHAQPAPPVRTRYSATSTQGKAMLAKYKTAVGLMKDATKYPPSDPRSWNFQWYTHWIPGPSSPWSAVLARKKQILDQVYAGKPPTDPNRLLAEAMWDDCQAHGFNDNDPNFFQEMYFCVWHRWFVYYFEQIIRGVLNDQTFTLPYWDYLSGKVSDLSIPPEFRDTSSPLYQPNRNTWVNNGERIDKQNPGSLNLDALDESIYIDSPDGGVGFCPSLDQNPHGAVHVYVGTNQNMGNVPTAANDPIFWIHHCNIDRLWESWNRVPGRTNPPWPSRTFPFANAQGKRVDALPAGADRTAKLNYQYDSYAKPPSPPQPPPVTAAPTAKVTKAFATAPVTLGTDRVKIDLAPATAGAAPPTPAAMVATSSRSKRLYVVLGDITAPEGAASTYNVFFDLPEGTANAGADHPNYIGTLNFFSAGHHKSGSADTVAFNATAKVRALVARNALTSAPGITMLRAGDAESEKPTIGHIVLIEV